MYSLLEGGSVNVIGTSGSTYTSAKLPIGFLQPGSAYSVYLGPVLKVVVELHFDLYRFHVTFFTRLVDCVSSQKTAHCTKNWYMIKITSFILKSVV
jgi:hypothetical protein